MTGQSVSHGGLVDAEQPRRRNRYFQLDAGLARAAVRIKSPLFSRRTYSVPLINIKISPSAKRS